MHWGHESKTSPTVGQMSPWAADYHPQLEVSPLTKVDDQK